MPDQTPQQEFFEYGEREMAYLSRKDKRLAAVIAQLGHLERPVDGDLFSGVMRHIIGQQISGAAQRSIWQRALDRYGAITPDVIAAASEEELQSLGISFRKAAYIKDFAAKVHDGSFDLDAVAHMSDQEAIDALVSLKGIGVWTAEMLLLFNLQRPDILSFGDLGIQRGMRMLYRHRSIDRERFERYRRRFSPYGSVASLYLWAIAGGAIPELSDPATKKRRQPLP